MNVLGLVMNEGFLVSDFLCRSNSNKVSFSENWGDLYNLIFSSLLYFNKGPIRVLELGVSFFGEGSGHAFSKMPWVERYTGVDCVPLANQLPNGHVFIRENVDTYACIEKVSLYAPFDLMIHDAAHYPQTQIFFLKEYFRLLKKPGVMLVENVADPKFIQQSLNDKNLCFLDVPPHDGWPSRGILKINF